jgi:hypothetical protein
MSGGPGFSKWMLGLAVFFMLGLAACQMAAPTSSAPTGESFLVSPTWQATPTQSPSRTPTPLQSPTLEATSAPLWHLSCLPAPRPPRFFTNRLAAGSHLTITPAYKSTVTPSTPEPMRCSSGPPCCMVARLMWLEDPSSRAVTVTTAWTALAPISAAELWISRLPAQFTLHSL